MSYALTYRRRHQGMLLGKLLWCGLTLNLINLFTYLMGRKQNVMFNCFKSTEYVVSSGVPQGSNLGLSLFNIFINDVVKTIDVHCFLYAE